MIDAHIHIDGYDDNLPKALEQTQRLSIRTLAVSMDVPSFQKTQQIAKKEPLILPSFGIHPWKAAEYVNRLDELDELLETAPAIGEIGLDRRWVEDEEQYPDQETVFHYFLDAAEQSGKLINLHTSGAEALILEHLRSRTLPAIIIHWYNGPLGLIQDYLDLGAYFTIGVEILRSEKVQQFTTMLPEDRILTETDNPEGWKWLTDETGFPNLLESVESEIAEIRNVPRSYLSEKISSNFDDLLCAGGISHFLKPNY